MANEGNQRQDARRWTTWRRLARVALALLAVLAVLVALALAATQTRTFRAYLRARAVEQVNAALAGKVSIGSIDGTLLGSLILNDVVLTLDGTEVVAIDQVAADYTLLPLLTTQTLVIERARATGVRAHLVQNEQGWNVARIVPPGPANEPDDESGSPIDVRVDELSLDDAALDVVTPDQSYEIRDLALRGSVEIDDAGQRAVVDRLTLALPARDLRLVEAHAEIAYGADGGLAVDDLTVQTDDSSLSGGAVIGAEQSDREVRLTIERLAATELHRLVGSEVLATDISGKLMAKGRAKAMTIDATLATAKAGTMDLGGSINLTSAPIGYDLRIGLDHLNVAGVLGPEHPVTDLTGTVTAIGAGYTLADAKATLGAELSDSAVADTRIAQLSVNGTIQNRQISARADLATGVGNGRLNGTLDLARDAYDVTIGATQLDPTAFLGRPDLHARLNGRAEVRGAGFDPSTARAQAQVHLDESTIDQLRVHALDARLVLADARLSVEQLRLDANAMQATASGGLDVAALTDADGESAPSGHVQYRVQIADLGTLATIAGQPEVAGRISIEGTASGSLRALDVDAEVTGASLAAGGVTVDTLTADVQGRAIGAERATATVGARVSQLRVGGRSFLWVRPQLVWQAGAGADTIRVGVVAREDAKHEHALRASAELGTGEIRVLLEMLRLELGEQQWSNSGPARIVWRDGRVELSDVELRAGDGAIAISGSGGTSGAQKLRLRAAGIALAPLLQPDGAEIAGTLSGEAQLSGSATAPQLDLQAELDRPVIEGVAYESVHADLRVADGTARASARVVQSSQNELTFTGRLPLQVSLSPFAFEPGESLSGQLRAADIDLAIFDPLIPQVSELKGTLRAELSLSGTPHAPELRGPISIRGGSAIVRATGITYDTIELQMRLDGSALDVQNLRIATGDGSLTASGGARLTASGAEGAVTVLLRKFPVFDNRYGEGVANGRIAISGTTAAPIVAGEIETERLVFRVPENLPGSVRPPDPTITVLRPTANGVEGAAIGTDGESRLDSAPPTTENGSAPVAAADATPGVYDRATIRIDIRVPRNAWLRRSDTEIELRGSLSVVKDPGEPLSVAGEINAVRGWYTFQGRKFTVEEGTVTLTGQDFNPQLDVVAVYSTADHTVRVRVGGTVQKPTLKLESEPPLSQADILSVLVFGRPADQLSQGESQGLRERALSVASGYAASEFRRSVADAIGVDTLEIAPGTEGLASTSASVGKYITDDVFVSLSHKFAEQNVQQLRVQYFITPRWTIETTADTAGESGIDVFWRRRY